MSHTRRGRIASLERRAEWLQKRIAAAKPHVDLSYDKAELSALRWAIVVLTLANAQDPATPAEDALRAAKAAAFEEAAMLAAEQARIWREAEETNEGFLKKLRDGGNVVSSNDCSEAEVAYAQACGRIYVDEDGFGYIYRPKPAPPAGMREKP
jgi:hypothetical protein